MRCDYAIHIQSTHRQRSIIDKRLSRNSIASSELAFSQKNDLIKFDSINIDENQSSYKVKINEKNCESFKSSKLFNIARESLKYILRIYNN